MYLLNPFKLKNPRKGTETSIWIYRIHRSRHFQIKESPEGDWNVSLPLVSLVPVFQIKESPEGDWNVYSRSEYCGNEKAFKLKNPRKGTETILLAFFAGLLSFFQIKESPEGDWNVLFRVFPASPFPFKLKNPRKGTETKLIYYD